MTHRESASQVAVDLPRDGDPLKHGRSPRPISVIARRRALQAKEPSASLEMSKLKDFDIIEKLGQGTFGVVQKAKSKRSGKLVALKQLINHSAKEGFPITAMREITILKQLKHKNILKISEMIFEEPKVSNSADLVTHRGCFYTVSPYMCSDLVGLLENPVVHLELEHIKCLMVQLLQGIQFIHESKFLHRDIKAANILIDFDGVLKIADFGLARTYHGGVPTLGKGPGGGERSYTGLVVTRWYRPPELLLGERKYTTAVDLWGIGCVFGELFTRKPILVGKSDVHQAQLVFGLVGPPTDWTQAALLPNKSDFNIGLTCKRTLEARFKGLIPDDGIELLSGLLALDPLKRFNALDALNHEFFSNSPQGVAPHEMPKFEECHEIDKERFKKLKERQNGLPQPPQPPQAKPPVQSHSQPYQSQPYQGQGYQGKNYPRQNYTNHPPRSYQPYDQGTKPPPRAPHNYNARNTSSYVPQYNSSYSGSSSYVPAQNHNERSSYVPKEGAGRAPQRDEPSRSHETSKERGLSGMAGYSRRSPEPGRVAPVPGSLPKRPLSWDSEESAKGPKEREPTRSEKVAERETSKPEARTSGPASAGIFIKKPTAPSRPVKRIKILKNSDGKEGNESELSDVDADFKKEEEEKLNDFLDYEGFQKDSEFRRMSNEKIKFNQEQKSKGLGMNY